MVFFKYGFVFLAGAAFGTAMAHRGQHHRHGHCWRQHWGYRGGDRGRWNEQEPAQASYEDEHQYQQERRGAYYYGRRDAADRDTDEREYRRSVKNKKSSAGGGAAPATTSDY